MSSGRWRAAGEGCGGQTNPDDGEGVVCVRRLEEHSGGSTDSVVVIGRRGGSLSVRTCFLQRGTLVPQRAKVAQPGDGVVDVAELHRSVCSRLFSPRNTYFLNREHLNLNPV